MIPDTTLTVQACLVVPDTTLTSPGLFGDPRYNTNSPGLFGGPRYNTNSPGLFGGPKYNTNSPGLFGGPKYNTNSPVERSPKKQCWDCDQFAIAVVTSLCVCLSPQQCLWTPDVMKKHVITCFEEVQMTPFHLQGQCHSDGVVYTEDIPVYCHCKLPYD